MSDIIEIKLSLGKILYKSEETDGILYLDNLDNMIQYNVVGSDLDFIECELNQHFDSKDYIILSYFLNYNIGEKIVLCRSTEINNIYSVLTLKQEEEIIDILELDYVKYSIGTIIKFKTQEQACLAKLMNLFRDRTGETGYYK